MIATELVLCVCCWLLLVIAFWWTYAPEKTMAQILRELDATRPPPMPPVLATSRLRSDSDPKAGRPDKCPECGSRAVSTLAKEITASTSWRCQQCGNVWNLGRAHPLPRSGSW